jgi:hypothetical protein
MLSCVRFFSSVWRLAVKSCPTCKRTYPDDEFVFCLDDGALLSAPHNTGGANRDTGIMVGTATPTEILSAPTIPAKQTPWVQSTIRAPAPQFIPSPQSVGTVQTTDRVGVGYWLLRAALLLRGLAAIIMTIAFFLLDSLHTFFALLGAYLFISGALAMMASIGSHIEYKRGGWLLMDAIASLFAGLWVLGMWGLWGFAAGYKGFMMLLVLLPIWALISGVAEIGAAVHLRRYITGVRLLTLAGVVSIICGLGIRYLSIAIPLAVHGIVCGVLLTILGLRLRSKAPAE